MKSNVLAAGLIGCEIVLAKPALAMDPACQPLIQSQLRMANTPVHIFMTETRTWSKALSGVAAGMGMGGAKASEEISTGKALYVMNGGKWIDMGAGLPECSATRTIPKSGRRKKRSAARCSPGDRRLPGAQSIGHRNESLDFEKHASAAQIREYQQRGRSRDDELHRVDLRLQQCARPLARSRRSR